MFQAFDDFADVVPFRFAEIFFFVFGIGGDQKDRFPKDEINVADPRTSAFSTIFESKAKFAQPAGALHQCTGFRVLQDQVFQTAKGPCFSSSCQILEG